MKNNKKEESDKEETEDAKTDAWWTTFDFVILGGDGTLFEDWRLNTNNVLHFSPVRTQFVLLKTDPISFLPVRKATTV